MMWLAGAAPRGEVDRESVDQLDTGGATAFIRQSEDMAGSRISRVEHGNHFALALLVVAAHSHPCTVDLNRRSPHTRSAI